MRAVKFLVFAAILFCFLPADVTAVTCDVAPLDPNCINCLLTPQNAECLVGATSSTSTTTTAAPLTTSTTKSSRRRRARKYFSKLFKRIRSRFQTLKKQLNPF
ncbi:uncharacterized protein LOC117574420 [Drosophila albomicans]|uniref:Uncharacterized protein LOC117574420 n=1 Tax=Drosophila albomicans TaxID=7291 RepID=A0A6P8XMF7_DROAB|nr:uncharacterized protein LOC117574420 [Drosophila albomicans]